jgi:hypothetical protein
MSYKIIRFHREKPQRVVARGLSLEDAQKHCQASDTHRFDKDGILRKLI